MSLLRMCFVLAALIEITWGAAIARNNVGILGGYEVTLEEAPYIVALYVSNVFKCGGSIIHESFILTAAHCVINLQPRDVQVLTGTDRLNEGGYLVKVDRIVPHLLYSNVTRHNDIALLKVSQPIRGSYWRTGLIDLPRDRRSILEGTMVNVTGWGRQKDNTFISSNELRQVAVPVVSNECCSLIYSNLSDSQMCAGVQGRDTCQGDSGGPLSNNGIQIGVVSFGYKCGIYPGVYTRTASYLTWVKSVIEKF